MGSDAEVIQFLEKRPERSRSDRERALSFSDSDVEGEVQDRLLRQALIRNMPMLRRRIETAPQSEWSLHEYLERLYSRLRTRLLIADDLDYAIDAGIKSLLHEDARNRDRRRRRVQSFEGQPAETTPDPSGLRFLTALVCQDTLRSFIQVLDPWTKMAFYAVHIDGEDVPRAVIARRFGMKENSFNKRFLRGIEKAKARYITLYGPS
jgi:hypothetical protein